MQLDKYKGVIKRAYDQNAGRDFEEFWSAMMQRLEIAADLMGDVEMQAARGLEPVRPVAPVSIETIRRQPTPARAGVILSAAPPVVGAVDDGAVDDADIDYYESKPGKGDGANRLQQKLQGIMPKSIQVQLPGFPEPLTLVCGIGSPGTKFAHVNYSVQGSQEMGPRVTIMTSQKDLDPDAILRDIVAQATAMYSPEKRVIVPRAAPPPPPPTSQDLQKMLERDRATQPPVSQEDAELAQGWAADRARSPQWR